VPRRIALFLPLGFAQGPIRGRRYPVEALCEPGVDIQSQGRMRQTGEGALIEGHGVGLAAGHFHKSGSPIPPKHPQEARKGP